MSEIRCPARGGVNAVREAYVWPAFAYLWNRLASIALAAGVVCLAGCSSLPGVLAPESLTSGFELLGRVSVRHGEDAATVNVQWRHLVASDDLLITNAIGQGVARITRSDAQVTLETADARRFQAVDAESLTEQVLGWRLPLSGLADWLRGRPAPGRVARTILNAEGQLEQLEQDAWQIDYQEYRDSRPLRMRLSRPNLELRLIVDSWREAQP
jgi:outer membrane lipoprotein LolB